MRPRGPDAGARGAALEREDRLAASEPARDARERARVPERFEIEDDELGLVVVLPPLEQVVRGDVRLVADRDERREAEAPLGSLLEQRQPERAALRGECDRARRERPRTEGCVEAEPRHRNPKAVWADEPAAVRADEVEQALLALTALGADLGEAGRDDAECLHAARERRLGRVEHERPGQADDCEVGHLGQVRHRFVGGHTADRLGISVDRIGGADEIRCENVPEELAADRAAATRGADHGDRLRLEERTE